MVQPLPSTASCQEEAERSQQSTSEPSRDLFERYLAQDSRAYTIAHERVQELTLTPVDAIEAADIHWLSAYDYADRLAACRDHMFELEEIVEHDREGGTRAERTVLRGFRDLVAAMESIGKEVERLLQRLDEKRERLVEMEGHCCEENR